MHCRILESEGIYIKGYFNLFTLQMWKLRPREGDTLFFIYLFILNILFIYFSHSPLREEDTLAKIIQQDKCQLGLEPAS